MNRDKPLSYLACPYSHDDRSIEIMRFKTVTRIAGLLMQEGKNIYSPITHSHPISEVSNLPGSWEYWEQIDRSYLEHSKELIILKLDGWLESIGVQAEIQIATELGLPIHYMPEIQP